MRKSSVKIEPAIMTISTRAPPRTARSAAQSRATNDASVPSIPTTMVFIL